GGAIVDLRFGQRLDVRVINYLLAVGQGLKAFEHLLQLVFIKVIAQFVNSRAQGMAAAVLAQNQLGPGQAYVLGIHDLVRGSLLEHAVLVNAGLVSESILTDNGLVPLNRNAGYMRYQPAGLTQAAGVNVGAHSENVRTRSHGHDDLFQRRVSGPFANTVNG